MTSLAAKFAWQMQEIKKQTDKLNVTLELSKTVSPLLKQNIKMSSFREIGNAHFCLRLCLAWIPADLPLIRKSHWSCLLGDPYTLHLTLRKWIQIFQMVRKSINLSFYKYFFHFIPILIGVVHGCLLTLFWDGYDKNSIFSAYYFYILFFGTSRFYFFTR